MQTKWKTLFGVVMAVFLLGTGVSTAEEKKTEEKKENLVWDAGAVKLEMEKLAKGVYAFYPTDAREKNSKGYPVATSGGFVVGDKGVLVV